MGLATLVNRGLITADALGHEMRPTSFINEGEIVARNNGRVTLGDWLPGGGVSEGGMWINETDGLIRATANGNVVWSGQGENHGEMLADGGSLVLSQGDKSWLNAGQIIGQGGYIQFTRYDMYSGPGVNAGLIRLDDSNGYFDCDWQNDGRVEVRGGSFLEINAAKLSNYYDGTLTGGAWEVYAGATLDLLSGPISTNAADILLSGETSAFDALDTLQWNEGSLTLADGRLFTTIGDLTNEGELEVGMDSVLTVTGTLALGDAAALRITLAESGTGRVVVQMGASLHGTLVIDLADGFAPTEGATFEILTAPTITGTFTAHDFPSLPTGLGFEIVYTDTAVTLVCGPAFCPGDVNCSGLVDFDDIDVFVAALGCAGGDPNCWPPAGLPSDCPWLNADCNNDGTVNFDDIDPFVARIGATCD
jgi:hypothetical protein